MPVLLKRCPVHGSLYPAPVGCYACRIEDSDAPVEHVKAAGKVPRGTIPAMRPERYELPSKGDA